MISILIPTFNYDASTLVRDFCSLAKRELVDYEIIIGDDASTEPQPWLDEIAKLPHVSVLRATTNQGRARNLNGMADAAKGEWLLIVDCDARIESDFSLHLYINAAYLAPVVCGGLRHPSVNPNPAATLRYKYERHADRVRGAEYREEEPYDHLSTFNIFVSHKVFNKVRFDEQCTDYGYEDTLFGADLQAHAYLIQHIDNPLVHIGLEDNATYLMKVETALHTLKRIHERLGSYSRVEATSNKLRRLRLASLVVLGHKLYGQLLRRNLLGRHPSLAFFQLYKLGYYLSL